MSANDREYQPDFDAEEQQAASQPRYGLARELARSLIKSAKLVAPPVPVEQILESRGLTLVVVDQPGKLSGQLHHRVREIVVNKNGRARARQRFTIAHELGHWELQHHLLGELPPDTLGYSGVYEGDGSSEGRSRVEKEANAFAAELLMPSAWIRRLGKPVALEVPQRLAAEYQASEQAMFYQLMHCKML